MRDGFVFAGSARRPSAVKENPPRPAFLHRRRCSEEFSNTLSIFEKSAIDNERYIGTKKYHRKSRSPLKEIALKNDYEYGKN